MIISDRWWTVCFRVWLRGALRKRENGPVANKGGRGPNECACNFILSSLNIHQLFPDYFLTYLGEMLLSIHEDGVPVQGAFAWGLF